MTFINAAPSVAVQISPMGKRHRHTMMAIRRWLVPVLVVVAMIFVGTIPMTPVIAAVPVQAAAATAGHCQTGHPQDRHQKHPASCSVGTGCFVFVASEAMTAAPPAPTATRDFRRVARLAARSIVPPLPPPISFVIA